MFVSGRGVVTRMPGIAQDLRPVAGPGVILDEPIDVVIQRIQTTGGRDASLTHGASNIVLVAARFGDELRASGQDGADGRSEALGEVDPDGIHQCTERAGAHAGRRGRVQEPRAVHVDGQPPVHARSATPHAVRRPTTAPPPKLWVCSTHTRRAGGPYGIGSV